jgi:hypothetical protein
MPDKDKRSPLKDKPLRQAGQSLLEEIDTLINDKLLGYFLSMALVAALAITEWYRWYFDIPPRPLLATMVAVLVVGCFLAKAIKIRTQLQALKLGRDGEKEVGEFLEHLRRDGCIVFHDIVGDNFNLDHVILSTKGIYAVETKTYSKPMGGEAKVHYDGDHLHIDGLGSKDEILLQNKAESMWLKGILRESTGREYSIKPVVVFPGWYVESKTHNKHWVLNPKALPEFIRNQNDVLSKEDVKLAAYHLSRYIRTL